MGEAKRRQMAHAPMGYPTGYPSVQRRSPDGAPSECPPPSNTGGTDERTSLEGTPAHTTDRLRINISVPEGLNAALGAAAKVLGVSVSQVTLIAVMEGLDAVAAKVDTVTRLRGLDWA